MIKYFLSLVLFFGTLFAEPFNVVLKDETNSYKNFELSYIKDNTNSLTIEEVATSKDFLNSRNKFAFGYMNTNLWLKINVKNTSNEDEFILSISEYFYEVANLHYFEDSWKKIENSVYLPLTQREVQSTKLAFRVNIPQGTSQTFYLELQGQDSYLGNISFYKKGYFLKSQAFNIQTILIFIFGIMVIIIVFNSFLWIRLREKIYLYYVGHISFGLIYLVDISGLLVYFDLQYYMYELYLFIALSMICLLFFSLEYLNAKQHLKYAVYILKIMALFLFISGCMLFVSVSKWILLVNISITILLFGLIITTLLVCIKGKHYFRFYFIAMLFYFTSITIFSLVLMGYIENTNFTRYSYLAALFVEIAFFSLLLTNRYHHALTEQIIIKNQFIDLQNNQNDLLKKEVNSQTKELVFVNTKLSSLVKERELLVKEVFHRVKNNFHMISAFLWFESKKDDNKNRFTELRNRIKSMSLIHEYLCNSKNLININLINYINKLITTIIQTYSIPNLKINQNIENIDIEFEDMMSLGIIINEIISNSIKHHQKEEKAIVLDISCLKKGDNIILTIVDNGIGFDISTQKAGFGLGLIKSFSKKLPSGVYSFYKENGTVFKLLFKDVKSNEI